MQGKKRYQQINQEKVRVYTWWERLKYARSRKWFCKTSFYGLFFYPVVPSNMSIHLDYIWRDIQVKNLKEKKRG